MDNKQPREAAPAKAPYKPGMNRKRKKVCLLCADKVEELDYKDVARLRKFVSERSKILPRRITGNCAKHQRMLTEAVKKARIVALLPYTAE